MFDQLVEVARRLVREQTQLLVGRGNLVMLPVGAGWPMRIYVDADVVRIITGMGSRIKVSVQDPSSIDLVELVMVAIQNGDVEEYLGILPDGHIDVIGHKVWYEGGSFLALDEGAEVLANRRAVAWRRDC